MNHSRASSTINELNAHVQSKLLHLSRSSVRLVVTEGFSKKINVLNQGKENMNMDFKDLEIVAEQDMGLMLAEIPAERTSQYQDAIPEEVLDLLVEYDYLIKKTSTRTKFYYYHPSLIADSSDEN